MRSNRRSIYARLEALEIRLISPLDRRIQSLSGPDRSEYERWKQRCQDHFRQYDGEPGSYFAAWFDGRIQRPEMSRHLERQLMPAPTINEEMDTRQAADVWADYREDGRR